MASVGPSGWFPDPARRYRLRYWDGQQWTGWATDGDQPIFDAGPRTPGALLTVLGIGATVAMPFAAWWLIGDESVTSRPRDQLDYVWHAPAISGAVTATMGAIALVMVVVGLVGFVAAASRRVIDSRWLLVLAAFVIAGGLLGLIGRVVTAGTIGANIGGALAILFGVPIVGLLIGYGFLQAGWLIVHAHKSRVTP